MQNFKNIRLFKLNSSNKLLIKAINLIKEDNIKILESSNLIGSAEAHYKQNKIIINSKHWKKQNIKTKLEILMHEWAHIISYRQGYYYKLYHNYTLKNIRKYGLRMEKFTDILAKRLMKLHFNLYYRVSKSYHNKKAENWYRKEYIEKLPNNFKY